MKAELMRHEVLRRIEDFPQFGTDCISDWSSIIVVDRAGEKPRLSIVLMGEKRSFVVFSGGGYDQLAKMIAEMSLIQQPMDGRPTKLVVVVPTDAEGLDAPVGDMWCAYARFRAAAKAGQAIIALLRAEFQKLGTPYGQYAAHVVDHEPHRVAVVVAAGAVWTDTSEPRERLFAKERTF